MTSTLIRTAAVALATVALAAPTALARPADLPSAAAQRHQAARSADPSGFPTRPVLDRPSSAPSSAPNAVPPATADRGIAWATIGIGLAASLLAIGAIAGIAGHTRRAGRSHITA